RGGRHEPIRCCRGNGHENGRSGLLTNARSRIRVFNLELIALRCRNCCRACRKYEKKSGDKLSHLVSLPFRQERTASRYCFGNISEKEEFGTIGKGRTALLREMLIRRCRLKGHFRPKSH